MSRSPPDQVLERDALVRTLARRRGRSLGRATEEVEAVCETLAELLDADVLTRLRRHLPSDLGELLEPPPARPAARAERRPPGHEARTLAEGRPGSRRPIDEAKR
jgi:hypothetical protein